VTNRVSRALIVLVGVLALLVTLLGTPDAADATTSSASEPKVDVYLTLLHNNDGESALLESTVAGQPFGGVAPFATLVDQLRREGDRDRKGVDRVSLLVSSGDNYLASAQFQASLDKGRPFYDAIAMDIIGYDAIAIGNHEFDFSPDVFEDFVRSFTKRTHFVSANLDFSDEPGLQRLVERRKIAESIIVREDGERFGIIGATTEALPIISSPRDVIIEDVLIAIQGEVAELKQKGIDKIILISHLQSVIEDLNLAALLDDVDIMVAGGGDELLANPDDVLVPGDEAAVFGAYPLIATDINGTEVPVVTTSGGYRYVGRLAVGFDKEGNILEIDDGSGPVRVTTGEFPDAVEPNRRITRKVVEPVTEYVAALATTVVATSQVPLNSARGLVQTTGTPPVPVVPIVVTAPGERVSDTNLGNLIADALLWQATDLAGEFGTPVPQIAFQNGGGLRLPDELILDDATPASPANLTRLDVNNQFPFLNWVSVVADVPLGQIKTILENGVSNVENRDGRFPHVSGMSFEWNSSGTANSNRVKKITIGGTVVYDEAAGGYIAPATADTTYDVATIDFLALGGDGYDFGGLPFVRLGATYEQAALNFLAGPLGGVITESAYPNIVNTRAIQAG
jgi:5'-nucleotidase